MKTGKHPRGVYERPPGSNNWYIRFQDENGKMVRRSIGHGARARKKAEEEIETLRSNVRLGLPTQKPAAPLTFAVIAESALEYSRGRKASYKDDESRMKRLKEKFGPHPAEKITPAEIDQWLTSQEDWADATRNRYLSLIKLTFRLAEVNGKIKVNPARLVRMRKENNQRIRYLDQFKPLPASEDWLRPFKTEERRLVAVIQEEFPNHLEEVSNSSEHRHEAKRAVWTFMGQR